MFTKTYNFTPQELQQFARDTYTANYPTNTNSTEMIGFTPQPPTSPIEESPRNINREETVYHSPSPVAQSEAEQTSIAPNTYHEETVVSQAAAIITSLETSNSFSQSPYSTPSVTPEAIPSPRTPLPDFTEDDYSWPKSPYITPSGTPEEIASPRVVTSPSPVGEKYANPYTSDEVKETPLLSTSPATSDPSFTCTETKPTLPERVIKIQESDVIFWENGDQHPLSIINKGESVDWFNALPIRDKAALRATCRYFYHNIYPGETIVDIQKKSYPDLNSIVEELKRSPQLKAIKWSSPCTNPTQLNYTDDSTLCSINGEPIKAEEIKNIYAMILPSCPEIEEIDFRKSFVAYMRGERKIIFPCVDDIVKYLCEFKKLKRFFFTDLAITVLPSKSLQKWDSTVDPSIRTTMFHSFNISNEPEARRALYLRMAEASLCCLTYINMRNMDFESLDQILGITHCASVLLETINFKGTTIQGQPITQEQIKAIYADIQKRGIEVKLVRELNLDFGTLVEATQFISNFKGVEDITLNPVISNSPPLLTIQGEKLLKDKDSYKSFYDLLDDEILASLKDLEGWCFDFINREELLAFLRKLKSIPYENSFEHITINNRKLNYTDIKAIAQHIKSTGQNNSFYRLTGGLRVVYIPNIAEAVDFLSNFFEEIDYSIPKITLDPKYNNATTYNFSDTISSTEKTDLLKALIASPKNSQLQRIKLSMRGYTFNSENDILTTLNALFERFSTVYISSISNSLLKDSQELNNTCYQNLQHAVNKRLLAKNKTFTLNLSGMIFESQEALVSYILSFEKLEEINFNRVTINGRTVKKENLVFEKVLLDLSQKSFSLGIVDLRNMTFNTKQDLINILKGFQDLHYVKLGSGSNTCLKMVQITDTSGFDIEYKLKNEIEAAIKQVKPTANVTIHN